MFYFFQECPSVQTAFLMQYSRAFLSGNHDVLHKSMSSLSGTRHIQPMVKITRNGLNQEVNRHQRVRNVHT